MLEKIPPALIAERLASASLPALRMERLMLDKGILLIDCYNANPRSVQAALNTLEELADGNESFAVLGDMRELGESSEELHWQTGRAVVEAGLRGLCAFGPAARSIARGAREGGLSEVVETESVAEAVEWSEQQLRRGGFILLKGSRAMRMERIAEALAGAFGVEWAPAQPEEKE
jgi:UDP-N-acetylmuramoyl-tripeptide--D-alanyl-D-alanine ligase